jgi:hypothetical protein
MNVIHSAASALSLPEPDKQVKKNDTASQLNLYNESPHFELSLDEFEVYALKRLKVRSIYLSIDRSITMCSLCCHVSLTVVV